MGDIAELFGGAGRSNLMNNLTQFELPSTRMSADAQTPAGEGAYAVPLGEETAHAQSPEGIRSRIGGWQNPTTDAFSMHTILLVGGVVVLLVALRRYFKGSVI